jgi:hypothetical protein
MIFEPWQRAGILAAVNYLRDQSSAGTGDPRAEALYQGLLEVLEPGRRASRLQRESAQAAKAAAVAGRERRTAADRRAGADRRKRDSGPSGIAWSGVDRRSGRDRRAGRERRAAS